MFDIIQLMKQMNEVRQEISNFQNGVGKESHIKFSIGKLRNFLKAEFLIEQKGEPEAPAICSLEDDTTPEVLVTSNDLKGNLFTTEGGRIIFRVEDDKDGVMFQDPTNYVIAIPNNQLHLLKKVDTITDAKGLKWNLEETGDERTVRAENELGDVVFSLKEVQKLIDGRNIY